MRPACLLIAVAVWAITLQLASAQELPYISLDRLSYYPGEMAHISARGDAVEIVTPSGRYRLAGSTGQDIPFFPSSQGGYRARLLDSSGALRDEWNFSVISPNMTRVEVRDGAGRPMRMLAQRVQRGGEEWQVLRPENASFLRALEVVLPPGARSEDITFSQTAGPAPPPGLRWERVYRLGKTNPASRAVLSLEAAGSRLYRCPADADGCSGPWQRMMDMEPGATYNLSAESQSYLYAEAGLTTVNTEKPMYHPGETARIWLAVLDSGGFPVSGAQVNLRITDPLNATYLRSTRTGDIREIRSGVYETGFASSVEGRHDLFAVATTPEGESRIVSSYEVRRYYEFDILREAPMIIDPWSGPFSGTVRIEPYVSARSMEVTERIPLPLRVLNAGGGSLSSDGSAWLLRWTGVAPGQTLSYALEAPKRSPVMYGLGPILVRTPSMNFTEARIWLIAADPPPEPHGVSGFVFRSDGSAVPAGIAVTVNDTNSSDFVNTTTGGPFSNRYSVTLNGSDNDTLVVRAFNATHWGRTGALLFGDTENANVTLNRTRPGEPNVTLLSPVDGQVFALGDNVSVLVNVTVVGESDAVGCNATVSFSTPGVIVLSNATQLLGNLVPGSATLVNWTGLANATGTTDVTVTVLCDANQSGFDTADSDTAEDVQVQDTLPPTPHGIAGWIFRQDNVTQVPLGTAYSINDTASVFFLQNVTRIPFPGSSGRYSETIQGVDGDAVAVRAWNATHFGRTSVLLAGDMDGINVTLNRTRPGEPNVTLLSPIADEIFALNDNVSIRANVTVAGESDAVGCNATVSFGTPGVIALSQNATQLLGNLAPGSATLVNWTGLANATGTTNVTVTVLCDANQSGFDTADSDTVDVEVQDSLPPTPHGIAGWIFRQDNVTQAPLGTAYSINDTASGFLLRNQTRVPFPGFSGRYSETMQGSDGDLVTVTAWNSTHFGQTNVTLAGDMEGVNVTLDSQRPSELNVSFIIPQSNTFFSAYVWFNNVSVNVSNIGGSEGVNCSVTLNISNTSVVNFSSGEAATHGLGNISVGQWNTTLWTVVASTNGTLNFTANASCDSDAQNFEGENVETARNVTVQRMPDLALNGSNITFSDSAPQENVSIVISANIENRGNANATNVTVRFYVDNLTTQLNGNLTVNVSAFSNETVSVNWTTVTGTHTIYVLVDPLNTVTEANETNNNASRNITISAWQIYYGPLDGSIVLDDLLNSTTLTWNSSRRGNIYVTETGSTVSFTALAPLGRNATQGIRFEDFAELDAALNMSAFNDSVNRTFTDGGQPRFLRSFLVYGSNLSNVSAVNTTNTSSFQTGILWDTSDDGNQTFDAGDREDLVFVTEINPGAVGQYGTYDYEIRVPAALRQYKYSFGTLSFYVELR
ncbi:hypothetical protein J4439_06325 [Candidatus Woesearchaeota archaeon]|nr:hypothetical protein [Candidatus Woesearchaeota archaeon]